MLTQLNPGPQQENNEKQPASTSTNKEVNEPNLDRPEGPFEHSGETFGRTEEEAEEKEEE